MSKSCYCAFCRSERLVYRKKHLSLVDATLAFVASLLLMVLVFQDFDPRFLVFFAVALGLCELFILLRWRLSLACPKCGFDPALYKKDHKRAAEKVKAFLANRSEDPLSALAPSPRLPVIVKKKSASPPPERRP